MDDEGRELRGQDILVEGPAIRKIGPDLAPPPGATVIDAEKYWVFPGLVNTHHHLYQTLTRCIRGIQEAELFPWLKFLYPIWAGLDQEAVTAGALVGLAELLKSGCTTASITTMSSRAGAAPRLPNPGCGPVGNPLSPLPG